MSRTEQQQRRKDVQLGMRFAGITREMFEALSPEIQRQFWHDSLGNQISIHTLIARLCNALDNIKRSPELIRALDLSDALHDAGFGYFLDTSAGSEMVYFGDEYDLTAGTLNKSDLHYEIEFWIYEGEGSVYQIVGHLCRLAGGVK